MKLTERDGDKVWFAHGRPRGFLCPRYFCDNAYGCDKVKDRTCPYLRVLDKLAAYEDAEERGLLVRLPCKVGSTVFSAFEDEDVFCGKVYAISTCDGTNWFSVRYDSGLRYDHTWDDIGKTVFLTRAEAEAALKGETKFVLSPKRAMQYLIKPRWIPVTERLPEESEGLNWHEDMMIRFTSVWCCNAKNGTIEVRNRLQGKMTGNEYLDQYTKDTNWRWSKSWWEPTHWMPIVPLPKPPKEET